MLNRKLQITLALTILPLFAGCSDSPKKIWDEANQKAKEMMEYEVKYKALQREHAKLTNDYFELEHQHLALLSEIQSKENAKLNLATTGAKDGRRPASLEYEVPKLGVEALYSLAFDHVREGRLVEAAATFEKVFHEPEAAALQNATAYYTAGVIWYKLKNFKKAKEYFDLTVAHAEGEDRNKYKGRVDLWQRAISIKINEPVRGLASEPSEHGE
jgi:tetratricopeptide (TPR) repeat protein